MTSWVQELSKALSVSEESLRFFLANASRKYKSFYIPKRRGGRRLIAQPSKALKGIQKKFLELYDLPCHPNVFSYRKSVGIRDNASKHANNTYFLCTDISDFFHSINPSVFFNALSREQELFDKNKFNELLTDFELLCELLFWRPEKTSSKLILSIGAPSSPTVSNFCLYSFDKIITKFAHQKGITYTRYADDMTFSTNNKESLKNFLYTIRSHLSDLYNNRLALNNQKTAFSSKKNNRHITGITITNDNTLSLGRAKKRYIKHLMHLFVLNQLNDQELSYLKGYISFVRYIEPDFIERLKRKYSDTQYERLIRS